MKLIYKLTLFSFCIVLVACASGSKSISGRKDKKDFSKGLTPVFLNTKAKCSDYKKVKTKYKNYLWQDWVNIGSACVHEKKWNRVKDIANFLSTNHVDNPWGVYFYAVYSEAYGNIDKALWMVELSLKKQSNIGLLHYTKGRLLWKNKEVRSSIESMKYAISLDKDLYSANWHLAQIYFRDQDYKLARPLLERVTAHNSRNSRANFYLAETLVRLGEPLEGEKYLAKAIELTPRVARYWIRRAELNEKEIGNIKKALSLYKEIQSRSKARTFDQKIEMDLSTKINELEKKRLELERSVASSEGENKKENAK